MSRLDCARAKHQVRKINRARGRVKGIQLIALASLSATFSVRAVNIITDWTGNSINNPDNLWGDLSNWDNGVAASGYTANFNSASTNSTISLGAAGQNINTIQFAAGAGGYNVGILGSGDTFDFDASGLITMASGVVAQTVSANIVIASGGTMGISNSSTNSLNIAGNIALSSPTNSLAVLATGPINVSGVISGSGGILFQKPGIINFTGNNTYTGEDDVNGNTTVLDVSYTPDVSSGFTFGPYGTGVMVIANASNPHLRLNNGNQTLYNPIFMGTGFVVDGTGNLTLAGQITNKSSFFLSNTGAASVTVGIPTAPSTITVTTVSNDVFNITASGGPIAVYDTIQNLNSSTPGGLGLDPNANSTFAVTIAGQNTFTGNTTVGSGTGAIKIGASSVGLPGSLTASPFGLSSLVLSSAATLEPVFADQTIGNAIAVNSTGFTVATDATDNTGTHSLTLSAPITLGGKAITNNLAIGATLFLGAASNPSTISLGSSILTIQNSGSATAATVINDALTDSGGGGLDLENGSFVTLANGSNSYTGSTTLNGGTLSVSTSGDLGSTSGITLNGGAAGATLLATGNFTVAQPVNLTGTLNTIDASSGNTLTLTGSLGGTGNLTTGTSGGAVQFAQASGVNLSSNVTVNATSLRFGATSTFTSTPNGPVVSGGGLSGPVNITGALTINANAKAALNPSLPGTGQNNSVGSLSIGNGGVLDIGNHAVIVQNAPDETVIGKYLSNGYSGGFWNGSSSSGGAITSVVAFNDNSGATSIGYGNSADFTFGGSTSPYRVGGPKALSGNQVVVAPALAGDLLLSGTVGPNELALLLDAFGTTGNNWAFGNIDYDAAGLVGPNDLSLLLSNFGHSSAGFTGAKTSAKSLTATAKPSLTASASDVAPPPADGIELIVNFQTGDVQIEGNNATLGTSIVLTSAANGLVGGTTFTPAFSALFNTSASNTNGLIDEFNTFTNGSAVNGLVDLGDVYNTTQNSGDIQFQFSEKGINRGSLQTGSVTYVGVPEPTTLSLLAVASAGLLGRRRRRRE
jgi:autotransporter-associated beta strand protein